MERQRTRHEEELEGADGGLPDVFGDAHSPVAETVTVYHGPYAEELPVVGQTVGRIRALFGDRFDLDPESQAVIDGRAVEDDYRIEAGQSLVFVRRAGEKGICSGAVRYHFS
jgi:hypothetical protein